jgi:magnesium transporter
MKQLAVLATIGLPFTIVTGFFGMNFKAMPWIDEPWGVAASSVVMAGLAAGLYALFRWRRWL